MRDLDPDRKNGRASLYATVTADLVESRRLGNRADAQDKLGRLVRSLNARFKRSLAAPFMVTLGDEIQGLLHDLEQAPRVVSSIHAIFHPSEISVGIGIGQIATKLSQRVTEMDGPAFVNARGAIGAAKKERLEVVVRTSDGFADGVLNAVYLLLGGVEAGWTKPQWERFNLYKELGKVEKVAARLGISKQSVSKSLRNTLWSRVLTVESHLPEIFASLGESLGKGPAAESRGAVGARPKLSPL